MMSHRFPQQMFGMILVLLLLVGLGCNVLASKPASTGQPVQPTGQTGACHQDQPSPLDVLRSTDHGATWTSLGTACFNDSTVFAVDPTPLIVNGRIVLYFLDMKTLTNDQSTATQRIIYRTTSVDGVNFDKPQPVFSQNQDMTDPFVLRMPDGSFRMYVASSQEGTIFASSSDGLVFTKENGTLLNGGGMPGALLLPDNRVRLFLAGGNEGQEGIFSQISSDGLNFTMESGVRIPAPDNSVADNPEPIHLAAGGYLMLYSIHDKKYEGQLPWLHTEMRLATSTDGLTWTTDPKIIGYGGTSCVVEVADGTLYLYYVNR